MKRRRQLETRWLSVVIAVLSCMWLLSRRYFSQSLVMLSSSTSTVMMKAQTFHSIGLGTYLMEKNLVSAAIRSAIELGYRRIDCAPVYFNEDAVGDAIQQVIQDGLVQRSDLFVVSKLASPFHRKQHVELALRKSLNDLRLDYLDLYLIHWPVAFQYVEIDPQQRGFANEDIDVSDNGKLIDNTVSIHETWQAMEMLVEKGLVKQIGVSNFPVALLHELLTRARIQPVVNQCEGHPYLQQKRLLDYCNKRGVHYQAYSPLGSPGYIMGSAQSEPKVLEDPILVRLAKTHQATTAQVCLAWAVQRGTSIVVKSSSPKHLQENLQALKIKLTEQEMEQIAALDRNYRFFRPEDWWPDAAMAVFE